MSAVDIKKTRTSAKRLFTRANNAVENAMKADDDPDLVDKKFQELAKKYSHVQEMHEEYICAVEDTDDYDENQCEEWINEIERTFTFTERMSHEYIKKMNGDNSIKLDNSVSTFDEKIHMKKQAECDRCETLRDFERMELINEAEKIKKLLSQ